MSNSPSEEPRGQVRHFPVEAGHIQLFAAAIGDANPAYLASSGEPVVAPPTFATASAHFDPHYPLRPRIGEPWFGSGKTPSGAVRSSRSDDETSDGEGAGGEGESGEGEARLGPGLHAEQHFEIHRPVLAGDVLSSRTAVGKSWEKTGRSGRLLFTEMVTEYRDQAGELVVTGRAVVVRTEMGTGS